MAYQTENLSDTFKNDQGVKVENEKSSKTKYSKIQWLTLITLSIGNFCVGACASLQAPFFPPEAEAKGATPTEYGLIFGVYQLAVFITSPAVGKLVSYIQPKYLLNAGMLTTGITTVAFGALDYVNGRVAFVALAFAVRILEGVGAACLKTSSYTIIAAQFPDNMSTAFASMETFLGIGLIIGPTLGGALYDAGGYGFPFYVVGSLVLLDAVIIFAILPKPERPKKVEKGQMRKFWLHFSTFVYALAIFTSFHYIGYNSATLEPHLRQFDLPGVYLGLMFGIAGSCYAITAPFWGWLCDRKVNAELIGVIGYILLILSLGFIGPLPFFNLNNNLLIVIIALGLMGFGIGAKMVFAFTGANQTAILRGFSSDVTTYGLISSMIATSQSLGAFVGPSIGGYLLEKVGYNSGIYVVLSIEISSLIFLLLYSLILKKVKLKTTDLEKTPILKENYRENSYNSTSEQQ